MEPLCGENTKASFAKPLVKLRHKLLNVTIKDSVFSLFQYVIANEECNVNNSLSRQMTSDLCGNKLITWI